MAYPVRRHRICVASTIMESHPKALVVFRGLEESLRSASEIGYDGIELGLYHASNVNVETLKKLVSVYGVGIPVISTGQMFTMGKYSLADPDRTARERALAAFEGIIEIAAEFGADVNLSRVRGSIPEESSFDEGLERFSECLVRLCTRAKACGIDILLEQMNRYETNYLLSCAQVGEYIARLGIGNLKIHADLFHMNIEDVDIPGTLKKYAGLLGFIHFADSNRLAPGKGNLDFKPIVESLDASSYRGWIGVEILCGDDPEGSARESLEYIRALER